MRLETERKMKRWREQRWILDQVIQTRGIDWDQGRTGKIIRNCGPGVEPDLAEVCSRIKKFVDIPREFSQAAARREEQGQQAEAADKLADARNHYYIAACFYTNAMWAIYEDGNPQRIAWQERKRACYDKFIQYAGRPIERVELPYQGKKIQALLHLPPKRQANEKVPCVMYIPGMDGVKEDHPATGDPIIERGFALLSIDGPGQGETREGGICCTASNYADAGRLAADYLVQRPEIDADRLGVMASSMGSYWAPRVVAEEHRFKACAVSGVCMEPGQHAIFNMSSPTFKLNYMYMSGYDDEAAFDEFYQNAFAQRRYIQDNLSVHGRCRRRRRALRHEIRLRVDGRNPRAKTALRFRRRAPLDPQSEGTSANRPLAHRHPARQAI